MAKAWFKFRVFPCKMHGALSLTGTGVSSNYFHHSPTLIFIKYYSCKKDKSGNLQTNAAPSVAREHWRH
jgi:hypothetical protein